MMLIIAQFQRTLRELDPDNSSTLIGLGRVYLYKGMYEEALDIFTSTNYLQGLALFYVRTGDHARGRELLARYLEPNRTTYTYTIYAAQVYLELDEEDKAFELLEYALEKHEPELTEYPLQYPDFDSIRDHPRFITLMTQLGLQDK